MPDASISFSQYQMWKNCPFRWKLNYIDDLGTYVPTIATLFGTAMHEVLQTYVDTLYTKTVKQANELPLEDMLKEKMYSLYSDLVEKNDGVHFSNPPELAEYYLDGVEIIKWFRAHRETFFMKKDWELVGIELPIDIIPVETHPTVKLVGFLDLVMKHTPTGKIVIYDFKTSKGGWGKYAKSDKVKISQLVLYKTFYSRQFDVSPDDISVEYLILKRKINEDTEYSAMKRRIQRFEPAHGKVSQNQILKEIISFITTNYNEDGSRKEGVEYPATPGEKESNCRFCEFKDRHDLCPPENRKQK